MKKHKPKDFEQAQKQAKPDPAHPDQFPGSSFAPLVPEGAPTDVAGYVTVPDARGGARYTASENYFNDKAAFPHGPPADACRKFGTYGSIAAFGLTGQTKDSVNFNCGAANLFAGAGYGADRLTPQLGHVLGSPHNAQIMSDTLFFAGPGEDGTPAVEVADAVAAWRAAGSYPRTPFANATDAPVPIGG